MAVAVVLHLTVIFAIMIPSFVLAVIPEFVVAHVYGIMSIITLIHVPLGIIAVSFGVWFVLAWRFQGLKGCFNRKKLMLATMIIWLGFNVFWNTAILYSYIGLYYGLKVNYLGVIASFVIFSNPTDGLFRKDAGSVGLPGLM